ncbi:hypothetical protein ACET3X_001832 [Alternaria dauci]|uniref:Uncharacterized protein n=1 Tax=Alternaria dauci TaxID=48095 RepID=A0ABR3UYX2_9PLEO
MTKNYKPVGRTTMHPHVHHQTDRKDGEENSDSQESRAKRSSPKKVNAQVSEEAVEHTYPPGVLPDWWDSDTSLSPPPSSSRSINCTEYVSPPASAPPSKKPSRKPVSHRKKKDHFEHPPENATSSFYFPDDIEGDTDADTDNDAPADTDDDVEDVDEDAKEPAQPVSRGPAQVDDALPPSPSSSSLSSSGLSEEEEPELECIVKIPSPPEKKKTKAQKAKEARAKKAREAKAKKDKETKAKNEKNGKKDKTAVKSKPAIKTTAGGRVQKNAGTARVQCNGTTKKNTRCGHRKTVPAGEVWNCGRHK